MKRIKCLYLVLFIILCFCLCSCGSSNKDSEIRPFVYIDDVPDDWSEVASPYCYYYEVDTHVVYIGRDSFHQYGSFVRLESAEYEGYIYDLNNNQFIGFNRE